MAALFATCCLCALPLQWFSHAAYAASKPLVAIVYGSSRTYTDAADVLEQQLTIRGYESTLVPLGAESHADKQTPASIEFSGREPDIVLTVGVAATVDALKLDSTRPIVFCMIPNALDAPFWKPAEQRKQKVLGVSLDTDPAESVDLMKRVCPKLTNVAVLHTRRTLESVEALRQAANAEGLKIVAIESDKNTLPNALETMESQSIDAVFMLPDAGVYNAATIKRLLVWGIRHKKPVWTFSDRIVNAGALGGVYSNTDASLADTVNLVDRVAKNGSSGIPKIVYPTAVRRGINRRTADMIGLNLSQATLGQDIELYGE